MNSIPLSPVDYIFTGVGSQPITFAFSYSNKLNPAALQNSLQTTLNYFPAGSSRLQQISETDFEFRFEEGRLTIEVVELDAGFDQPDRIEHYITPVNSLAGELLTRIKLTQTPNRSVLAVSMSHALVDGFSYFHFLSSWARICRGDQFLPPYLQRNMLLPNLTEDAKAITAEDIYVHCGLFYGEKRSERGAAPSHYEHLFLSDESIKAWLDEAKQTHDISFTANDVITAVLWKKYIPRWRHANDNPATYLTCPVDFRRALTDFPKNYFGCALCFATAAIDFEHLQNATLGELALLIRTAVSKIKDESILQSLSTFHNFRRQYGIAAMEAIHLRHPHHGMIITNLTRMPIKDLDFGCGAPADFLTYAEVSNSAALLPAENGVDVLVLHPLQRG